MKDVTRLLLESWQDREGSLHSIPELLSWIQERNDRLKVSIEKVPFSYHGFWHYDEEDGYIRNNNNSFFQLAGYQEIEDSHIVGEQPIIIQDEIGYLGILAQVMNGRLHFLMQAKIEPGNVNAIQLSPTIQATRSNFTRQHGGKAPAYLSYFENPRQYHVLVDQLQSEQSSRFYKKRNRNIVLLLDEGEKIPLRDSHRWMTLGQIKELMRLPNLVNMDTRTVLSCLPFSGICPSVGECSAVSAEPALLASLLKAPDMDLIHRAFSVLNDFKMYHRTNARLLPLKSLKGWRMGKHEIVCRTPYDFKVIYCRIEIEDREVNYWEQPLIEALGTAVIGVFTRVENGVRQFLVRVKHEMGCFDGAELGPLVQLEPSNARNHLNALEKEFLARLECGRGVIRNVMLSEEGGRFYHEQNQNVILEAAPDEFSELPEGFFWMDYATLNQMIQFNNCVNIQLRNLMALVDF